MSKQSTPIEAQLDEILVTYLDVARVHIAQGGSYLEALDNANGKILDLFAHLASEAKPEKENTRNMESPEWNYMGGYHQGIDTYHTNLRKAIGKQ